MALISYIIPVYNEAETLRTFFLHLNAVVKSLPDHDAEIIFIDDGSADTTASIIEELITGFGVWIRLISFTRNFGKESATSAGLAAARGEAAIMLDADLQHPPELIPLFLEHWHGGWDVVIGVREQNTDEGLVKRMGSWIFYRIMNLIGETHLVPRATDFRLLSRTAIDAFKALTERERITRGLIDWLGFPATSIHFTAPARYGGTARYSKLKLIKLALSSFISHSLFPLKFAGYLGVIITLLAGTFGLFLLVEQHFLKDPLGLTFSGTAELAIFILFLVGIVLSCLGLIALYIASIQQEVLGRPLYVIKKKR